MGKTRGKHSVKQSRETSFILSRITPKSQGIYAYLPNGHEQMHILVILLSFKRNPQTRTTDGVKLGKQLKQSHGAARTTTQQASHQLATQPPIYPSTQPPRPPNRPTAQPPSHRVTHSPLRPKRLQECGEKPASTEACYSCST